MTFGKRPLLSLFLLIFILAACNGAVEDPGSPATDTPDTIENVEAETADTDAEIAEETSNLFATPTTENAVVDGETELLYGVIPVGFTEEGHAYMGNLDASVVVEEYSDYQCPYCARFHENTLSRLIDEYVESGDMLFIYKDFPLNFHEQAMTASIAARCAGEQSAVAYWTLHDKLFQNMGAWSNRQAEQAIINLASESDIDGDALSACLEENDYEAKIRADLQTGSEAGIRGTPSFLINGELIAGALPFDNFKQAIEAVGRGEKLAAPEQPQQAQQPSVLPTPEPIQRVDGVTEEYAGIKGSADALVLLVEYTDYQCPFCARHATQTVPQLQALIDDGIVQYALKDFPLDSIHPQARQASAAARCAKDQGAYWEMHDALFEQQGTWSGADFTAYISGLSNELGLNAAELVTCIESGTYDEVIQANLDEGIGLGITGTPSFIIDGFALSGAQPFEAFEEMIGLAADGGLEDWINQQIEASYARAVAEQQAQPTAVPTPSGPVDINIEGAFSIGAEDAPVTIVEFTDFQCPFCQRHHDNTYPEIVRKYVDTGQVRYVFKDFPLTNIHPQAVMAAQAARCAGDQGEDNYVAMHDIIFTRLGEWNGRPNVIDYFGDYAELLELDAEMLKACVEAKTYEEAVYADLQQGIDAGVRGTPAFFVNGAFLSGAQPLNVFEQAIEAALSSN